jgi:hypothetical protein
MPYLRHAGRQAVGSRIRAVLGPGTAFHCSCG